MSPRNQFLLTVAFLILILGVALFSFLRRAEEPVQVHPATIDRDCAPWDGAAFTITLPLDKGVIRVSIYRSPELRLPSTFRFPDETLMEGSAFLFLPVGLSEPLSGRVTFQRLERGIPVEGAFDLTTQTGQEFKGKFKAEWGDQVVYCA